MHLPTQRSSWASPVEVAEFRLRTLHALLSATLVEAENAELRRAQARKQCQKTGLELPPLALELPPPPDEGLLCSPTVEAKTTSEKNLQILLEVQKKNGEKQEQPQPPGQKEAAGESWKRTQVEEEGEPLGSGERRGRRTRKKPRSGGGTGEAPTSWGGTGETPEEVEEEGASRSSSTTPKTRRRQRCSAHHSAHQGELGSLLPGEKAPGEDERVEDTASRGASSHSSSSRPQLECSLPSKGTTPLIVNGKRVSSASMPPKKPATPSSRPPRPERGAPRPTTPPQGRAGPGASSPGSTAAGLSGGGELPRTELPRLEGRVAGAPNPLPRAASRGALAAAAAGEAAAAAAVAASRAGETREAALEKAGRDVHNRPRQLPEEAIGWAVPGADPRRRPPRSGTR